MLTVDTNRRSSDCDGQTRRDFLKVGGLGMGALGQAASTGDAAVAGLDE